MAAFLDRHAPRRPVIRLFERQFDVVLDVLTLLRPRRAATSPCPSARLARTGPSEERPEEVGEGVLVAEEILHLIRRHRPVTAGTAHVDGPGVRSAGADERTAASLPMLLRLFV